MGSDIPMYDLEVDYIVGEAFEANLLSGYKNYPSETESSFFILCVRGMVQVTINGSLYNIGENALLTLPSNYIMEIQEFSPDIHIHCAGFSPSLIEGINLMKATQHLLLTMTENLVVILSPLQAHNYKMSYESLIPLYTSPIAQAGREITRATLIMFLQGPTEIYRLQDKWYLSSQSRKREIYQEFLQLVMKYYTVHHGASFYADQLGPSLPHFCSTIKETAGDTPLEVIASVILMGTGSRLKSGDEPVKNTALSLGFNNISFSNKLFRQHTGITPHECRGY